MRSADPGIPGPKVSDDIQLTYVLDDLGFNQRGSYGVGSFVGGRAGFLSGVDLHVLAPGGILVRDVVDNFETLPAPNDLVTMRTEDASVVFQAAAPYPRIVPGSPQIREGPPPLSIAEEGHINFFLSGYTFFVRDHPLAGSGGFFVRFNRHLQVFNNQLNTLAGISILYDELLRDERQPPPAP